MTIRILIADDDTLLRTGLAAVLRTDPWLELVGEAADGLEAIRLTEELHPDVVLMDVRMHGVDGIEATRRIVTADSNARILVLTTFPEADYVADALRAGASGVPPQAHRPRAPDRSRPCRRGRRCPTRPDSDARGHRTLSDTAPPPSGSEQTLLARLTDRELEVLDLLGRGWSNGEIANALTIAESTAQTHVKRVLAKLGARDRAQAVAIAHYSGAVQRS